MLFRSVTGEVNPSGHTTATFAANSLSAPSAEKDVYKRQTCAYAVQHIASKLAYMPIIWLIQHGRTDRLDTLSLIHIL